ncbi:uncharacterized protein [Onthophagus taurus]|uniref:uncharacterized protein n=1 Tax=Onthophagus taurus TaxID=166361 RepID=UPI0039BE1C5C
MLFFKFLVLIGAFFPGSNSLIVPGEIPTLLSLIYSNIPTIKKGTDSRLGWGFRLGNRADFQVLVELGPQTNTQPLANQQQPSGSSKRESSDSLRDILWAQRQQEKLDRKKTTEKPQFSNTNGGGWLKEWSESMQSKETPQKPVKIIDVPLGIGEVDAKLVIPEDDLNHDEKDENNEVKSEKDN